MKIRQIASVGVHHTMPQVPERRAILAAVLSRVRQAMGHGVTWKTGAAYLTLRDCSTVAVPRRTLAATLRQIGPLVPSVR